MNGMREESSPENETRSLGDIASYPELRAFLTALNSLRLDNRYVLDCLTELLQSLEPVSRDGLPEEDAAYLVKSGAYSAEELARAQDEVNKGGLQLNTIEAFLSSLLRTLSLGEAAGYVRASEADVLAAVARGDLHAVKLAGRTRFPSWQFHLASKNKLLPGLDRELLSKLLTRWPDWRSVSGFMSTPQEDLIAEGSKTPTQWLKDGGDRAEVVALIEAEEVW